MSLSAKMALGAEILRYWVRPFTKPLVLGYDVTYRCNLDCAYCGNSARDHAEMNTTEALSRLRGFVEAGLRYCVLGGAEPLGRSDLSVLAEYVNSAGVLVELNTNGVLLPQRPDVLKHIDGVALSYDGPQAVHDRVRGIGSHARVLAAIDVARSCGVPLRLSCTMSRANVGVVDDILDFCHRESLPVSFQPTNRIGSGAKRFDDVAPSPEALKVALIRIREAKRRRHVAILNTDNTLQHFSNWPNPTAPLYCAAARVFCRMNPTGEIYACTGQANSDHVSLANQTITGAMTEAARGGCAECWCGGDLDLGLLFEGGPLLALHERRSLWSRWSGRP